MINQDQRLPLSGQHPGLSLFVTRKPSCAKLQRTRVAAAKLLVQPGPSMLVVQGTRGAQRTTAGALKTHHIPFTSFDLLR